MTSLEKDLAKNLKIKGDVFINILLLGETGVGKSTFINSIANYLTYSDFKKAKKEDLITLIASKWEIPDKHGEFHVIHIGSDKDKNECLETGMSATQGVKSYVFPIWGGTVKVRLIDTPGMGDCRGVEQDNINCENILSYIGQLHELHAICFLFKPTNPRITVFFEYCMTQILSRLDKSASKNIIFVFTNTRGTDYGPGDTFPSLQKVIDGIKAKQPQVEIPLSKNLFCFDNESFRYLAAVKQGVKFDTSIKERNCESWKKSVEQCNRLIKYIVGDSNNPSLKPHFIKSTSAINEARRLIVQLAQPLAEISQLISDNIFVLKRHQEYLDLDSNTLDELKQKLYIPVINLDVTTLTQPVTVCASRKCAEIYKVEGKNKWHYKQRCHDPCYLTNVPKDIIGSPELVNCAAMNRATKACTKCLCDFSTHMHIYYLTKTVEGKVIDDNVKKNIDTKEKLLKNAKKLIADISTRKDELQNEHSIIVRTCAKFAHFLQNNAITPFSDSYKEYIEYLIIRERSLGVQSNMSVIHHLQNLLSEYEAAKHSFNEALVIQQRIGETAPLITPQKIQDSIQELYKLKHNGKKIKELYECQKKSRSKEHKYSEYVHEVLTQPQEDRSKENKDESKNTNKNFYQKKQFKNTNQGNKKDNTQQRERNQSQTRYDARSQSRTRYNARDQSDTRHSARSHSPPPSYQDLHPDRQYRPPQGGQYHHQDHSGPYQHFYGHPGYPPQGGPWSDYPNPGNRPPAHHGFGDAPPPGPGYGQYNPSSYDPRYEKRDFDTNRRNSNGSDKFEFKVVFNKSNQGTAGPPQNAPPSSSHPPRPHFQNNFHPPPPTYPPYPPYHENPHQYSSRPFDGYHGQNPPRGPQYSFTPRGPQNPGPYQNRPSERGAREPQNQGPHQNKPNRGGTRGRGGSSCGRGQNKTSTQKFKTYSHKKKTQGADSDSDSDSDSD